MVSPTTQYLELTAHVELGVGASMAIESTDPLAVVCVEDGGSGVLGAGEQKVAITIVLHESNRASMTLQGNGLLHRTGLVVVRPR